MNLQPTSGRNNALFLALILAIIGLITTPQAIADPRHSNAPNNIAAFGEFFGEYGGFLDDLRRWHTGPKNSNESNHYIEMWKGQNVRSLTRFAGLTNNNALFINSHGKAKGGTSNRPQHAYYPHNDLIADPNNPPCYSARDFATILGDDAAKIHNIILAGCDLDRSFRAAELRKHFVNATNITHIPPGKAGYQPMYLQAFLSPSKEIKPLYESAQINPQGAKEYHIKTEPSFRATKLNPYIAKLYRPGKLTPYRTQRAGRELLETPQPRLVANITAPKAPPVNLVASVPVFAPPSNRQ